MSTLRHLRHGPKNAAMAAEIKQVVEIEEKRRKDFPLHCMLQFRQHDAFKDAVQASHVSLNRPNLGIQNKTALAIAATTGHHEVVEVLLEHLADTDMVYYMDGVEYTVDELVKRNLHQSATLSTVPSSLRNNWRTCLDLLKKEMTYRANSTVYVEKLRSKFQALTEDEPFDEVLFRRAIKAEPSLGRLFLTDCLRVERHELSFSKLELIYGIGDDVQTSALHALLHLESDNADYMFRAKQLLEHVVFRRILALKWEFFAQRLFVEQIMSYVVVLISMSISVTLHSQSDVSMFPTEIGIFTITLVFAVVGFGAVQLLRPKPLWLLARFLHDGKLKFEPMLTIPNLSALKVRAKWCIVLLGVVGTLVVSIPLLLVVLPMIDDNSEGVVGWVVNGTLWLAVCYFVELEWREFQGDNGTFWAKASKYFKSNFNCAQVVAYMLVLLVYVPHELKLMAVVDDKLVLCLGCLLTLGLWILSLQYVAVFRTGGYLLPMMSGILQDVWNFATFFAVFQLGLTCVFYQLFHNNRDVSGYESFFHAFCTTFFVLFGQFKMETWDSDSVLMADPIIFAFSIVLVLFHACVVTVILMNVLLATVNKTVDRGLVTSKVEALWSYAECILRLEVTLDPDQQKMMAFIDIPPLGELPTSYDTKEATPLVPSSMMTSVRSNSWQYGGVLNPAFSEKVSKAALGAETLQATKDVEEHVKIWDECVNDLETSTLDELETVMGLLQRTSHFTTSPYHQELTCMSDAIPKVMHVFMDAKKKRAPTAQTKTNRIQQLHKKVHRELMFLKTQLSKLPHRPTATMFYQVVHGVRFNESLANCIAAIQRHFDDVVDKLSMAQEQNVSDLSLQLEESNQQTTTQLESHSSALREVDVKVQAILQIDQAMRDQQGETQAQLLLLQQHVAQQQQLLESMAEAMASLSSTVRSLQRPRYSRSAASRRRLHVPVTNV
ncbi:hypothetical protein DYB32_003893 [Aphanomyces invadans]|uniref:Uncharacterized protein n=1 Tax=Aphanomyces invadans TaxID=157072 RepID=A0A3R6ZRT0_9STRA|nr:hypothetical protein DYB32_003893 [Aphanomyces invadans]